MKYRDFDPLDPLPADFLDALNEFISSAALNFTLRIKPSVNTTLQVPAGTGNDQVAIGIQNLSDATKAGWRYISANVERASPGGVAQTFDVWVTGSDNSFAPSGGGEVDSTDYSFALAIVAAAATPSGVALGRKVATAVWDGTKFTAIDVLVGAQSGTARHAARHATTGDDPVSPASIGAVATGDSRLTDARTPTAHATSHGLDGSDPIHGIEDLLQPGVVGATDGQVSTTGFNPATGALSATTPGGLAWVANVAGEPVRGAIPTSFTITPASLPANTKYACYGIDLVVGGGGAAHTVAITAKGTDQTSAPLALAAPPAPVAGHLRIHNFVILNTGGTLTAPTGLDMRPFVSDKPIPGVAQLAGAALSGQITLLGGSQGHFATGGSSTGLNTINTDTANLLDTVRALRGLVEYLQASGVVR